MNNPDLLVCYVLMRTDMDSLTPGKAMAQSHHNYGALKRAIREGNDDELTRQYLSWQKTTNQDFGTVIVLGGTEGEIDEAMAFAERTKARAVWGWVWDDEYPLKDGSVVHMFPLPTNAFVFGTKLACEDIISAFEWHA